MAILSGKKVAVLVDDYFEEAEFTGPIAELQKAGASVEVVAPKIGTLHSMNHTDKGKTYQATRQLEDVRMGDYDALVLPGGAVNADHLRINNQAKIWVRQFLKLGKPVAAICHAPWIVASAGLAKGRRVTSYETIQDDLRNAGAYWVDEAVVVDQSLITSRTPDDIPAFNNALISMLQAA